MGEKRALIVATSQYEDAVLRQLVAPAQDAEALARVLQDPAIAGFDVRVVLNEASYKVNQELEAFFADRRRDDLLFLYFSCHGIKDEDGRLYFAAPNTHRKMLRSTAIRASDVNEIMLNSRSRRQVLVLDCCHSGAFARGLVAKGTTNVGARDAFEGQGRVVLTASDSMQYSFEGEKLEGEGVRSVFTRALVHGLESGEADLDGDGLISLDELYSYVHDRVTSETPQQNPRKWSLDVEGEIIIARTPHPAVVKPAKLPIELQESIEDPRPWVRMGALQELGRLLQGQHKRLALAAYEALSKLKNDDSRELSIAAETCLAAYDETQRLRQATAASEKAEAAEIDRLAGEEARREEAERERLLAARRAEAEHAAKEREEAERRAREQAEQNRLSRENAETERLAAEAAAEEKATRQKTERHGVEPNKAAAERIAEKNAEKMPLARGRATQGPLQQTSGRKIWGSAAVAVVSLTGAIWYFAHRQSVPVNHPGGSESPTPSDTRAVGSPTKQESPAPTETRPAENPRPQQSPHRPEGNRASEKIHKSSGVLQGSAVRRVEPVYPQLAKAAHITGVVIVEVTIDEEGNVIAARYISGPPLLAEAALSAARGWKFRQTTLRGRPVKVVGSISFNFTL